MVLKDFESYLYVFMKDLWHTKGCEIEYGQIPTTRNFVVLLNKVGR